MKRRLKKARRFKRRALILLRVEPRVGIANCSLRVSVFVRGMRMGCGDIDALGNPAVNAPRAKRERHAAKNAKRGNEER